MSAWESFRHDVMCQQRICSSPAPLGVLFVISRTIVGRAETVSHDVQTVQRGKRLWFWTERSDGWERPPAEPKDKSYVLIRFV